MRGNVVLVALVATLLQMVAVAWSQDAPTIRHWMVANDADLYEAAHHFGISVDSASETLGLDADDNELGFLWATCVNEMVTLEGTTKDIGLDKDQLEHELSLRVAYEFLSLPTCDYDFSVPENRGQLWLTLYVWTVGDTYPVAYYEELSTDLIYFGGEHQVPRGYDRPWDHSYLGAGEADYVQNKVFDHIGTMVGSLAEDYSTAIGR